MARTDTLRSCPNAWTGLESFGGLPREATIRMPRPRAATLYAYRGTGLLAEGHEARCSQARLRLLVARSPRNSRSAITGKGPKIPVFLLSLRDRRLVAMR